MPAWVAPKHAGNLHLAEIGNLNGGGHDPGRRLVGLWQFGQHARDDITWDTRQTAAVVRTDVEHVRLPSKAPSFCTRVDWPSGQATLIEAETKRH
jgi:hypothetical protein